MPEPLPAVDAEVSDAASEVEAPAVEVATEPEVKDAVPEVEMPAAEGEPEVDVDAAEFVLVDEPLVRFNFSTQHAQMSAELELKRERPLSERDAEV